MNIEPQWDEAAQARRLRRMKRIPLWLLLAMAALFALTLNRPEAWAGWVHAFAEAGMVGALADWFAVVALFRHPLGVPVPHTAIIPTRKDELGEAMARFVSDHFLEPRAVRAKLDSVDLAAHTVAWLQSPRGQARLLELSDGLIRWAIDPLDERRVRRFLSRVSRRQLERLDLAPRLGHGLEWLLRGDRHQEVLTQVFRYLIVQLDEHGDAIRARVREESPWWVPGFIDDRVLRQMLDRGQARLFEMSLDPEHPQRRQLNDWLGRLAEDLKTNPEHRSLGERYKQRLLENDELQDYLYGLWVEIADRLRRDLDRPDSRTRREIAGAIEKVAAELAADADMQALIDGWLTDGVVALVDANRLQVASLISDTVRTWDGAETSRRVELALGRDLQFIRINGTLVGGLVGVVIHAVVLATS